MEMKKAGKDGQQNHPSQLFFHFTPLITILNVIYFGVSINALRSIIIKPYAYTNT